MKKIKDDNRITVRLSKEAYARCQEAKRAGYSTTDFVMQSILKAPVMDKTSNREVLKHFCQIQILIQGMKENSLKKELREELNEVCQFLK